MQTFRMDTSFSDGMEIDRSNDGGSKKDPFRLNSYMAKLSLLGSSIGYDPMDVSPRPNSGNSEEEELLLSEEPFQLVTSLHATPSPMDTTEPLRPRAFTWPVKVLSIEGSRPSSTTF